MPDAAGDRPRTRAAAQPLGLEHREAVEPALERLRRPLGERTLSDLTFSNLYLFRAVHEYHYLPGELACIRGRTYDGAAHLLPLFDPAAVPSSALAALLEPGECFYPVPSDTAARLDPRVWESTALRDDSDYLYPTAQFIDYQSKPLRGQRAASRRLCEHHIITQRDVRHHDDGRDALEILARWSAEKKFDADAADARSCREALRPPAGLVPLEGTIYYVDERPAGFLLCEMLNPQVWAVRFAKGLAPFDGIYPCMFQQLSRAAGRDLRWLNFEQDLGKPNFRKAKSSYAPSRLLEKCRLRLREGAAL